MDLLVLKAETKVSKYTYCIMSLCECDRTELSTETDTEIETEMCNIFNNGYSFLIYYQFNASSYLCIHMYRKIQRVNT
jgi:hypothetical protein